MSNIVAQASFNSGEWAPSLYARVDMQKYRSGAALLENWFVDYRGGASTRTGSKYVIQAYKSATQVRLINFQASFNVGYVIEIGDGYMRFIYQGAPVVETAKAISGATQANPCVLTIVGSGYSIGDWIYVSGVSGMTQLNGRYFRVQNVVGNAVTIGDLNGVNINSTGYSAYSSGGNAQRIYTIASPYTSADDLRLIKFTQNVNQMLLCHPNHEVYVLTLVSATSWTLVPVGIGSTATAPTNVSLGTTLGAGSVNYSYGVTSIDSAGQESIISNVAWLTNKEDIRSVAGSIQITWDPVAGAVGYNVYEANPSYFGTVPYGVQYGFIGTCVGTTLVDSNISPDFSQTPPIARNPFVGAGVDYVSVTAPGAYTTVPGVTFTGTATTPATGRAVLAVQGTPTISAGGAGYAIGDSITFSDGLVVIVTNVAAGVVTAWSVSSAGAITTGSTPTNPIAQLSSSGGGTGATATATWGVDQVIVTSAGAGYTSAPAVTFSAGAAAATAVLQSESNGNPTVPAFCQQRLVLAGQPGAPNTFYMSRTGAYFNYDVSSPSRSDDAITGTLVSGKLTTIKSVVASTAGMIVLTDTATWLVNGGQAGAAITPSAIVANPQSFVGANDVPPIVANYDILFVESKGSGVRDLAYNIYYNVFTGTDISILSSHLFHGYSVEEWAWSEKPFYMVWAVRNDGVMLTLTFLKEQEFVGWAHSVTDGDYKSVAIATENTSDAGVVDAVYTVVERSINGNTVKYIERFADRIFPNGKEDAICVDSAIVYSGTPATNFTGGEHLAGELCTGLADGEIISEFTMPTNGMFTLGTAASKVVVGKAYNCDLQTLALDIGEPTVQGKVKKISSVDVRVNETLGLQIGQDASHLVNMKDLVDGAVGSMLTGQATQVVSGLFSGDARTIIGPAWTVPGQYFIRQNKPYPATVLGVFPTITVGDK